MQEFDSRQFVDRTVKSIKFLNRKERKKAVKRGEELANILKELSRYENDISITRDLPRQELRASVVRYLLGLYDDSIHHAFFSVEMAMLVRLEEELPTEEKNALHDAINRKENPLSFTFGAIFNKAKERKIDVIRGDKLRRRIESLIENRNTYIHGSNFLSGLITSMKKSVSIEIGTQLKQISDLESMSFSKLVIPLMRLVFYRRFLQKKSTMIQNLPDFAWCSRDKNREAAQRQVDEYISDLENFKQKKLKALDSKSKTIWTLLTMRKELKEIREEVYFKKQSYRILNDSFEILKELGYF